MCGITRIFTYHGAAPPVDYAELRRIRDHIAASGPDGEGEWLGANRLVGLSLTGGFRSTISRRPVCSR